MNFIKDIEIGDIFRANEFNRLLVVYDSYFCGGEPKYKCFVLDTREIVALNKNFMEGFLTRVA